MKSNYGKGSTALNNFDFDFGIGNNKPRSLNDQKNKSNSYSYSSSSSSTSAFSQSKPTTTSSPWQPNKPSWTHQPAPNYTSTTTGTRSELGGPTSMVGDIFGKSWNSTTTSSVNGGIANKDPSLFGDLVSSALGQNKGNNNVQLKSGTPVSVNSSFLMGGMANSLPKTGNNSVDKGTNNSSWGGAEKFGNYVSAQSNSSTGFNSNNSSMNKSPNLGGPSMRSLGGAGSLGVGMNSGKDPFGSLVDFSKPSIGPSLNSVASKGNSASAEDFNFGDFQKASNMGTSTVSSDAFGCSNHQPNAELNFSSAPEAGHFSNQNQPAVQSSGGVDSFNMFFSSSTDSTCNQHFSGGDDWGIESEFGDVGHDVGATTELEGLPPPPAGVSASTAKSKGQDNYKQGQYADAIKWLSWAVVLFDKSGDVSGTMEVLSCRASCYKEVGEYKKAVADCTKVLDHDGKNVSVLVQRALLYESMEKYKLGAEDLRTVMKLDPGNRVARSTIHRLTKLAEC